MAQVDGQSVVIGTRRLLEQEGIDTSAGEAQWRQLEGQGKTTVGPAAQGALIGLALGLLNPILAGAAMALSSVSVVTNAALLGRFDPFLTRSRR